MNDTTGARVTGNNSDGWNVEASMDEHDVVLACASEQDARDLAMLIDRCSWFQVVPQ